MNDHNLSRRHFLKTAVISGGGLVIGLQLPDAPSTVHSPLISQPTAISQTPLYR